MTRMTLPVPLVLTALLAASPFCASAESPSFTEPPTAANQGNNVRITFTVNKITDVEVAVLNAKGRVIRHLVAGMLGPNAPQPLKKDSLEQELIWDGNDDLGGKAQGGPFRVRVALGMRPTFEKVIGSNPADVSRVSTLAMGPDGTLYVWHAFGDLHPGDGSTACVAFDRKGKYVRHILPLPANLPEGKLDGLRRVEVEGKKQPYLYQGETRNLFPCVGELPAHRAAVLKDGVVLFRGFDEVGRYNHGKNGKPVLLAVRQDGGVPQGGPVRARFALTDMVPGPDGKVWGLRNGNVVKVDWKSAKTEVVLKGKKEDGSASVLPAKSRSLALGGDGKLYVAGADRIAVFNKDRKHLGDLAVPGLAMLAVHPKSGALYGVKSDWRKGATILKFNSWKDAEPAAKHYQKGPGWRTMVADFSAEPTVIWLSSASQWNRDRLLRLVDKGATFSKPVGISRIPGNAKPNSGPRTRYRMCCAGAIMGMALDRANRVLFVNQRSYNLKTGKWGRGNIAADGGKEGVGSFGLDGNFYSQRYSKTLWRFTSGFKPLPFPGREGKEAHAFKHAHELGLRRNGVTADAKGNIFACIPKPRGERNETDKSNRRPYEVWKIGADGKLINKRLIASQIPGLYSVRVDYQGNIYVAASIRPKGQRAPDELGKAWAKPLNSKNVPGNDIDWYPLVYGCILKFGPEGGAIRETAKGPALNYGPPGKFIRETKVEGAKWTHFGASPLTSWRLPYPDVCLCESPRFDVDGYGRSFFPDAARFRVGILDTNGNLIRRFGSYGNMDSAGPKSKIPAPAIPLAWPYLVAAEDGHVYVGDRLNRRVVAVALNYDAIQVCDVK